MIVYLNMIMSVLMRTLSNRHTWQSLCHGIVVMFIPRTLEAEVIKGSLELSLPHNLIPKEWPVIKHLHLIVRCRYRFEYLLLSASCSQDWLVQDCVPRKGFVCSWETSLLPRAWFFDPWRGLFFGQGRILLCHPPDCRQCFSEEVAACVGHFRLWQKAMEHVSWSLRMMEMMETGAG